MDFIIIYQIYQKSFRLYLSEIQIRAPGSSPSYLDFQQLGAPRRNHMDTGKTLMVLTSFHMHESGERPCCREAHFLLPWFLEEESIY